MVHMQIFVEPTFQDEPDAKSRTINITIDPQLKNEVYQQIKKLCKTHYGREIPEEPDVYIQSGGVEGVTVEIDNHPNKPRAWYEKFNVDLLDSFETGGWNLLRGFDVFDKDGMLFKREGIEK